LAPAQRRRHLWPAATAPLIGFHGGPYEHAGNPTGKFIRLKNMKREGRGLVRERKLEREWGKENEEKKQRTPIYMQYRTGPVHLNQTGSVYFKPFQLKPFD